MKLLALFLDPVEEPFDIAPARQDELFSLYRGQLSHQVDVVELSLQQGFQISTSGFGVARAAEEPAVKGLLGDHESPLGGRVLVLLVLLVLLVQNSEERDASGPDTHALPEALV